MKKNLKEKKRLGRTEEKGEGLDVEETEGTYSRHRMNRVESSNAFHTIRNAHINPNIDSKKVVESNILTKS